MHKIKNKIRILLRVIYNFIFSRKIVKFYKKNDNRIFDMSFFDLNRIKNYNIKFFKKVKKYIEEKNIIRLKSKEKIKIGFVLYTSSMWSCDDLFNMLINDEKYDPYIIVGEITGDTVDSRNKNYSETLKFFNDLNYNVIGLRENENNYKRIIEKTDIFFYLTPNTIYQKEFDFINLPLSKLVIHIPYSFMIADRSYKFNLLIYQLSWKFFVDTLIYKNLMKKYSSTGDDNIIFCGYTRMDEFLNNDVIDDEKIWKIPNKNNNVYKIIYAPHHSVFDEAAGFSTFDLNYEYIYELAKKYSNNTSWIIKPHPLLRGRIVQNGFFKDTTEYDDYLKKWEELPNAKVVTYGTYFDIFKTSDTMILDSASFLAEYQYTHKPLLFLTRESQKFNEFGDKLKDVLYCVDGKDLNGIDKYLNDVIFNDNDYMYADRKHFFDEFLNYFRLNGEKSSSEYIYEFLNNNLK